MLIFIGLLYHLVWAFFFGGFCFVVCRFAVGVNSRAIPDVWCTIREQNNRLMTQLYGLLESMQQAPGNTYVLNQGPAGRVAPATPPTPAAIEARSTATDSAPDKPAKTTAKSPRASKASGRRGPSRKRQGKRSSSANKGRKKAASKKITGADKYLPTLSRFFKRSQ